eukprot:SM000154S01400  [mRNA]  locus=s154:144417:149074:- [translate_table: standard]
MLGYGGLSVALADAPAKLPPPSGIVDPEDASEVEQVRKEADPAAAAASAPRKKRMIILGSGWGAISVLKTINSDLYDITIISPRNYFVFTPLLPSVTNGTVEARSIAEPVRRMLWSVSKNARPVALSSMLPAQLSCCCHSALAIERRKRALYLETECCDIDPHSKIDVSLTKVPGMEEFDLEYDYLVAAVGAQVNTFNTPGVKEYCHFLKEVEDATEIREHVIDLFESASKPMLSIEEKRKMLHFVVVGGGPTGVEFAAELHDFVKEDVVKLYPGLTELASITLVQSGDHILNMFDKKITEFAEKKFNRDKVDVKTNARVIAVTDKDITIKSKDGGKVYSMDYGLIVWSTGIGTRPVVAHFVEHLARRALATDEWLRVKGTWDEDINYLFKRADKNGDGKLTRNELKTILEEVKGRYPQIAIHLKRRQIRNLIGDMEDRDKGVGQDKPVDIAKFKEAISKVDAQMKTLPATAQVAAQQGEYLGKSFNKLALQPPGTEEGPLRIRGEGRHRFPAIHVCSLPTTPQCLQSYQHLGQFAPLGGGVSGLETTGEWVTAGRSAQWLWYSVYFRPVSMLVKTHNPILHLLMQMWCSKQVSWRTRCLVLFDWTKTTIFGRDSSRIADVQDPGLWQDHAQSLDECSSPGQISAGLYLPLVQSKS